MSNSALVTCTRLSPNRTHPRSHAIDTVTIHCVVGQWTAQRGCDYFAQSSVQASPNYFVGKDGSIGLCVEEGDRSWCTGGTLTVNGITGKANDHRAVTIEVASDTTHPYAVTPAAFEALIRLVADIARRNGLGELKWKADKSLVGRPEAQNMTVHRWFANKACPGEYLYTSMGEIARRANEINYRMGELDRLAGKNNEEECDMTKDEVKALVADEVATATAKTAQTLLEGVRREVALAMEEAKAQVYNTVDECPAWARAAVAWAVAFRIIRGDEQGRLGLDSTKLWGLQVLYNAAHSGKE